MARASDPAVYWELDVQQGENRWLLFSERRLGLQAALDAIHAAREAHPNKKFRLRAYMEPVGSRYEMREVWEQEKRASVSGVRCKKAGSDKVKGVKK